MNRRDYAADEMLRNGVRMTIRAARPDDRQRIEKAFGELDRESVRTRFFGYRSGLSPAELARLDAMDFVSDAMLLATVPGPDDETVIGSARYVAHDVGDASQAAEVAFTVEEDYRGLGIAGQLLKHLATIARASRIVTFEADVLSDNTAMLAVFKRSGWPMRTHREAGVVHVTLALNNEPASV